MLGTIALGTVTAVLVQTPAPAAQQQEPGFEVIASQLKNPRGITVLKDGTILVAESGEGLPGCAPGARCAGLTGSVYRVKGSKQGRVVTGLPSWAQTPEQPGQPISAAGPVDVERTWSGYTVLNAFGGTTDSRTAFGDDGARLGTLQRSSGSVLGDMVEHETVNNPDSGEVNANPWRFVPTRNGYLATDAGGNDLVGISCRGRTSTVALFPKKEVTTPTGTNSVESVPTGIVKGPDGAYYVADLGAINPGASRIWRVVPGHEPQVFVDGLTALSDLALDRRGNLVALTLTGGFQQAGPPLPGALHKINLRTKAVTEIPTDGRLAMSTGLAVGPDNAIYVSNNSVGTQGELLKITP